MAWAGMSSGPSQLCFHGIDSGTSLNIVHIIYRDHILCSHIPVEHHLHVVPNVRVPVLVDGEAGAGVQQLDVHDPHLECEVSRSQSWPITL